MIGTFTASVTRSFTVIPIGSWNEKVADVRTQGLEMASQLKNEGKPFAVGILAPREMPEGDDPPVQLSCVLLDLDWKLAVKLEMVESARDIMTKALTINALDSALPTVLKAAIEGNGFFEHSIGEFFLLYGKFEEKYGVSKGRDVRSKMKALLRGDDNRYMKNYVERGKIFRYPVPYIVRNIFSHKGHNLNQLDPQGADLRTSIDLLKQWVK